MNDDQTPEAAIARPIQSLRSLAGLRDRLRRLFLIDGAVACGLALCAAILATFALDYFLHLPWEVRLILLAIAAISLGRITARRLLAPARLEIPLQDIASLVESHNPALKQSLVTAVRLTDPAHGSAQFLSGSLIASVVDQVEKELPRISLDRVIDLRKLRRAGILLGALVLFLAYGAAAHADIAGIWFRRLFLLSADRWPKSVQIEMVVPSGNPVTVALGEDLPVEVRAVRGQPAEVEVRYWTEDRRTRSQRTDLMRPAPDGRFRKVFENISQPFRFQVRGGDDELPPVRVEVQIRPKVSRLKIWCRYPEHTGLRETPPGEPILHGHLKVPAGTEVRFQAAADVPVAKAYFQFLPGRVAPLAAAGARTGGTAGEPGAAEGEAGSWPPEGSRELEVETAEGSSDPEPTASEGVAAAHAPSSYFSGSFTVETSGAYTFHLRGENGLVNRAPVTFRVQAIEDRRPTVRILEPARLNEQVSPSATIRIRVDARDDYGIKEGSIRGVLYPEVGDQGSDIEIPLPELLADSPLPTEESRQPKVAEHLLEIAELKAQPGYRLQFYAAAIDFGGNIGQSEGHVLHIVGEEEVLRILHSQLMVVRDQIQEALRQQESARKDLDATYQQALLLEKIDSEEAAKMSRHRQNQQRVSQAIRRPAEEVQRVLQKMAANNVGDERERQWIEKVQRELSELAEQRSPAVEKQIQDLREEASRESAEPSRIQPITEEQKRIERDLSGLALRLTEFGDLNAILQEWRVILQRQNEIRDRIRGQIRQESGAR